MKTQAFSPTGSLLTIWLIGTGLVVLVFAGIVMGVVAQADGNAAAPVIILFVGAIPLAYEVLYFYSISYEIDSQDVVRTHGVLWKSKRSTPLVKITNIDVRQGPLERALGFGQIWIFTPSTGSLLPEMRLIGVVNPHEMKQLVVERVEHARSGADADEGDIRAPSAAGGSEVVPVLREILAALQRIEGKIGDR